MKSSKGACFERQISRMLSLWWSNGAYDDWFWRSSQSGGRATVRARSGKTTANSYGDISAMCQEASEFLSLFSIECKRGYNGYTIQDLLDNPGGKGFCAFVEQAKQEARLSGTPYWLLIHKRDRRNPIVVTNYRLCPSLSLNDYYTCSLDSLLTRTNHTRICQEIHERKKTP